MTNGPDLRVVDDLSPEEQFEKHVAEALEVAAGERVSEFGEYLPVRRRIALLREWGEQLAVAGYQAEVNLDLAAARGDQEGARQAVQVIQSMAQNLSVLAVLDAQLVAEAPKARRRLFGGKR